MNMKTVIVAVAACLSLLSISACSDSSRATSDKADADRASEADLSNSRVAADTEAADTPAVKAATGDQFTDPSTGDLEVWNTWENLMLIREEFAEAVDDHGRDIGSFTFDVAQVDYRLPPAVKVGDYSGDIQEFAFCLDGGRGASLEHREQDYSPHTAWMTLNVGACGAGGPGYALVSAADLNGEDDLLYSGGADLIGAWRGSSEYADYAEAVDTLDDYMASWSINDDWKTPTVGMRLGDGYVVTEVIGNQEYPPVCAVNKLKDRWAAYNPDLGDLSLTFSGRGTSCTGWLG